jgi:alginate O-acetyltransferase complex protein AlgI
MLFNSFIFFIFLGLVWLAFRLLPNRRSKVIFLLAASYFFYGYWDWRFTGLLAISTTTDFLVGRRMQRTDRQPARKRLLLLSCLVNLGILGVFKYLNFFAGSAQAALKAIGVNVQFLHLNILLPVGISFYTFKTLSYSIDVYRRRLEPTRSFLDYALFVSFFPNLVAGPIDRASSLLPQIANVKPPTRQQIKEGFVLISLGLFKKVLIGDAAARIVNNIFGQPELYRSPELLSALVLFSIQIYADFAGYSNIARGVAKLFGLELMKNFEQPYLSRSFSEFWRRWHISLSTWIWDYIFNPLMSSFLRRVGRWKLSSVQCEMRIVYPCAAMITMLLCGLWHGAGLTFVIWGGLHGLFLSAERLVVYRNKAISMRVRIHDGRSLLKFGVRLITTQFLVLFAWLFFRAKDIAEVRYFINHLVHWQGSDLTGRFLLIVASFVSMILLLDIIEYASHSEVYLLKLRPAVTAGVCVALIIVASFYMATTTPLPFVYFQF